MTVHAAGDSVAGYEPWDVLIGHTLGVDHAGHTFNMDAPEMSAKLSETDDRVAEVSRVAIVHHFSCGSSWGSGPRFQLAPSPAVVVSRWWS